MKHGQRIYYPGGPINQGPAGGSGVVIPSGSGAAPSIGGFDFTSLSLGFMTAGAFKTATATAGPAGGLDYARADDATTANACTVQTSASAVNNNGGSGIAANNATFGSDGTAARGLIVQPIVQNLVGTVAGNAAPRNVTVSWSAGTAGTQTGASATGVDGTANAASTVVGASGTFGPFGSASSASPTTFSSWQHGTLDMQQVWNTGSVNTGSATVSTAGSNYRRLATYNGASASDTVFTCQDARDYSGVGGQVAQNRSCIVDMMQVERGNYVTEAIPFALTTRQDDRVSYSVATDYLVSGRLRIKLSFYPKFSSADLVFSNATVQNTWTLFSFKDSGGTNTNALNIDGTSGNPRKFSFVNSGVTVTSTNPISWTAGGGLVEIIVEIGNNVASVCKYRQNGGAYTDLALPTVASAITASGAFGLMQNLTATPRQQIPVRMAGYNVYGAGGVIS